MSRARDNADGSRLDAPLASPAFTGTPTGITAAHLEAGVLPSDVTGGSGLTALGTVAAGNLSHADIVYPVGHVIQIKSVTDTTTVVSSTHAFHDCGNLSLSITTTNNNKVFLMATIQGAGKASQNGAIFKFVRVTGGSTSNIEIPSSGGTYYAHSANIASNNDLPLQVAISLLDSPSTGTHVYKLQIGTTYNHSNSRVSYNRSLNNTTILTSSVLTLMEVVA